MNFEKILNEHQPFDSQHAEIVKAHALVDIARSLRTITEHLLNPPLVVGRHEMDSPQFIEKP